ncbi:MAG: family 10 glycosylhydrolase [Phormidesmis sp.]
MNQVLRAIAFANHHNRCRSRCRNVGSRRSIYKGVVNGLVSVALVGNAVMPAIAKPSLREIAIPAFESIAQPAAKSIAEPIQESLASTQTRPLTASRATSQPEIRSIWLDRETIVNAGSPQGLAKVFERFKAAGINTVFVETVNAGYPIYRSEVAPEQNPLIRGWDPLQAAVDLGRSYNMEIHAWVWLFAAGNQAHNPLVGQPAHYPGPILAAHPDWAGFDNHGNLIIPGQTKPFLDPANPAVREYLFDLLSEIADRYDVDGIQFDYVRYPFQDPGNNRLFGYGTAARQQFHALTGTDPITLSPRNGGDARKARLWNQWTAFRTQQISSFVAAASTRLRRQRPDLILSAAVFADDTYKRQQELQQDWEDWADQGLVDWIVLMSYASNTQRFAELIRPWIIESSYRSTSVIPGIRLLNLPAAVALDQIQLLQDMPTRGYALFAADNLNGDVQEMLASMQGEGEEAGGAIALSPNKSPQQR